MQSLSFDDIYPVLGLYHHTHTHMRELHNSIAFNISQTEQISN